MENKDYDLFESHRPVISTNFWEETYKSVLLNTLMAAYKPNIIRHWRAVDFVVHKDGKVLVNWVKRFDPLSDEAIKEGKY